MPRILLPIITILIASLMLAYSNILSSIVTPHLIDVKFYSLNTSAQKEVKCLADNIYFESAHEPDQGKMAVAFVTLNRTRHKDFQIGRAHV